MKKTTHCSECKKVTECTYVLGEFLCKKCLIEQELTEDGDPKYYEDENWFNGDDYRFD